MPASRSFRRVSRVWHCRAAALRRCVWRMIRPAFSNFALRSLRVKLHDTTNALNAVLTWHAVNSGFFPPPAFTRLHTEQVGQGHQALMPYQPRVTAALEVIETQLRFLIL